MSEPADPGSAATPTDSPTDSPAARRAAARRAATRRRQVRRRLLRRARVDARRALHRYRGRSGLLIGLLLGALLGVLGLTLVEQATRPDGRSIAAQSPLRIVMDRDVSAGRQRIRLLQQWNDLQRGLLRAGRPAYPLVDVAELAADATAWHDDLVTRFQSREPADVVTLDVTWTPEFAEGGYLRPIDTDRLRLDDFLAQPMRTCEYGGQIWALPFNTDVGLLYYNTALIQPAAGRFETWDRLTTTLSTLDLPAGVAAYVGQFDSEGLSVNVQEILQPAVDSRAKVTVSDAAHRQFTAFVERLTARAGPFPAHNEERSYSQFSAHRAAVMRNWPLAIRRLGMLAENPVPFAVSPVPGGGMLGGQNLAVTATSERPIAAQALIEFLTDTHSQQQLFQQGGFAATRRSTYFNHDLRQAYGPDRSQPDSRRWTTDIILDAVENARLRPREQHYARFSAELQRSLRPVLTGAARPPDRPALEQALTRALTGRLDGERQWWRLLADA